MNSNCNSNKKTLLRNIYKKKAIEEDNGKDKDKVGANQFFNYIYQVYSINKRDKDNKGKSAISKSFIRNPPKSGIFSHQKKQELLNKALQLIKSSKSNIVSPININLRSSSAKIIPPPAIPIQIKPSFPIKASRNNKVILQVEKQNKAELPISLPASITYMNHYNSFSEKNRHQRIMDLRIKLQFFIDNMPDKANEYLKEFILRNGINEDSMLIESRLNNLKAYLINRLSSINPSKGIRDIIEEGLKYNSSSSNATVCVSQYVINKIRQKTISAGIRRNNSNSLSIAKIDLFKYMNMHKQMKINKELERERERVRERLKVKDCNSNNSSSIMYNKSDIISELEHDICDALLKKEKQFKEMNKTLMSSFSFLTSNINNHNTDSTNKLHKDKANNDFKPFMLTMSRTKKWLRPNSYYYNRSVDNKKSNSSNTTKPNLKLNHQKTFSTNQINQRLYYDYVNRDRTKNKMINIKKAKKLTEYILCNQTKNQLNIEKAMKEMNIVID